MCGSPVRDCRGRRTNLPPYPKLHRELNWIEYFWGRCKNFTRKHYNYTLVGTVAHTASHWLMVFMLTPGAVPAALTPPQSVRP